MATITRVGFCPLCAREDRPKTGQEFHVFGSTSNQYFKLNALCNGQRGYVPHMYILDKVIGENVVVFRECAMSLCNAKRERFIFTLERWNSLVMYKRDLDYEI